MSNITFDSATFDANGKAAADYGVLKTYAALTLTNYLPNSYTGEGSGCGSFGCFIADPVYSTAKFTDTLTITGGTGTGYLFVNDPRLKARASDYGSSR